MLGLSPGTLQGEGEGTTATVRREGAPPTGATVGRCEEARGGGAAGGHVTEWCADSSFLLVFSFYVISI